MIEQVWDRKTRSYTININLKDVRKSDKEFMVSEWFISQKKVRKNKKIEYPKEFSIKRRNLLENARNNNWCTACWTIDLLQVHHIDKDKFNNSDENLLVLCYYCHSKEHKHMQWKKPPNWLK